MITFRRILVPVDFSPNAELAVQWAVTLLKDRTDGEITMLHVPWIAPIAEAAFNIPQAIESLEESARKTLEDWRKKIPAGIASKAVVSLGDPADDIVSYATEHDADLIVMVTSGRHGIARLAHPNLTEKVVRLAQCPVVVLHANNVARVQAVVSDR